MFNKMKVALALALAAVSQCGIPDMAHAVVSSTLTRTVGSLGNGVTVNQTIGFDFRDNSQLVVTLQDESATPYTQTTITYGAGAGKYTLSAGNPATTVIMGTAPSTTQRVIITRSTALVQPVAYDEAAAFPAADTETQMDNVVFMVQENQAQLNAKVGLSPTSTASPTPIFPDPLADRFILYNHAGTDLTTTSAPTSGDFVTFNGSAWVEVGGTGSGSVVRATSPTITGATLSSPTLTSPTITGAVSLGSTLEVTGATTLDSTLAVVGVATFTAQPILSSLTASQAVFTDGSKGLVSNAITGTGNVVMSASPTLTGTIGAANATFSGTTLHSGVATFTLAPVLSSTTASQALFTDSSKNVVSNAVTGTGNVVMSAGPTLTGTIGAASETLSGTLSVSGATTVAALTANSLTIAPATGTGLIAITPTTGTNAAFLTLNNTGGTVRIGLDDSTGATYGLGAYASGMTNTANTPMTFATNNTERMRIAAAGGITMTGTLGVTGVATLTAQPIVSSLTASQAVFSDGSKGLVSNAITGSGNVVMSASPTLTGTIGAANETLSGTLAVTGVATLTAQPILSSLTASLPVFSDGSKGLVSNAMTGTGNVVMSAGPTLSGIVTFAGSTKVDASGNLFSSTHQIVAGHTAADNTTTSELLQSLSTTATAGMKAIRYSNDSGGSFIELNKSRGSIATLATINSNDTIGTLQFSGVGTDAAAYTPAAAIIVQTPGGVGSAVVPGKMLIQTANTAGTLTSAMIVTEGQAVQFSDGTAGSPGMTFQNRTNTGIYRSASATMSFSAGGTDTVDVSDSVVQVNGTLTATGVLTGSSTTDASSSTTGGTILSGGLGVAKKLYVGTNLAVTGTTALTGVATLTAQPILSSLTASQAVFTDGSKGLVSNAITGSGNVVMSASPTLTGTIGAANETLSGTMVTTGTSQFTGNVGIGAASGSQSQIQVTSPTTLSGTWTNSASGTTVTMVSGNQAFTELKIGDTITMNGETRTISAIGATTLTTDAWTGANTAATATRAATADFFIHPNGNFQSGGTYTTNTNVLSPNNNYIIATAPSTSASGSPQAGLALLSYTGTATGGPTLVLGKARGTEASMSNVISGDTIGQISFRAYHDSTGASVFNETSSQIASLATQDQTSTNRGTQILIKTVPNNTTTLTTALTIDQDQSLTFGGAMVNTHLTTGTNADTVCLKSDGTFLIQAAACTISSRRFKENINDLTDKDGLAVVMALKPVEFNMISDPNHPNADKANFARTQVGLIAEDVEQVDRRLAIYEPDGITPKSYRQEALISVLVKGVQEQQAQIKSLQLEVETLKKSGQ